MARISRPRRIGVIALPRPRLNEAALQTFVLAMNKEQTLIQFEFYKTELVHPALTTLSTKRKLVDKEQLESQLPDLAQQIRASLIESIKFHDVDEGIPEDYVIISQARFSDEHYVTRVAHLSVLALGNWRRMMSPPSLLEFVQVLLVREALALVSPELADMYHLGTKSCLMDFTPDLSDARQKVLYGYVCDYCAARLRDCGPPQLLNTVTHLIDRAWLGSPTDPRSPAGIAANLGADLFIVKGLRATTRERLIAIFSEEGVRQVTVAIGLVVAAVAIFFLGIKNGG
jgi:hypothetical protein